MSTTTANYTWSIPTVGGDVGAWGAILKTTIEAIDAKVHAIETGTGTGVVSPVALAAEVLFQRSVLGAELVGRIGTHFVDGAYSARIAYPTAGFGSDTGILVLPNLQPGYRLTGFTGSGYKNGNGVTATIGLGYVDPSSGTYTPLTSGTVAIPTGSDPTAFSVTGLTHDVIAGMVYVASLLTTRASPAATDDGVVSLNAVRPTVVRP